MPRFAQHKQAAIASVLCLFISLASGQQPLYASNPVAWRLTFAGYPGSLEQSKMPWGPMTPNNSPQLSISNNVSRPDNASLSNLPSLEGLQTPSYISNGFSLGIPGNGTRNCQDESSGFGVHNSDCVLTLGPNSQLIPSSSNSSWPTLPFSMNLGNSSSRQGFIAFGGAFDADAVGADQWILIPETTSPDSTFLKTGRQELRSGSAKLLTFDGTMVNSDYKVVLDFNADGISFGGNGEDVLCSDSIGVRFTQSAGVTTSGNNTDVFMGTKPSQIVASQYASCYSSADPSMVILGKVFFQAAIMYVNETGAVYLTQARQQTGTPNWQLFNPQNLTLKNVAAPPAPPAPPKSGAERVSLNDNPLTLVTAGLAMLANLMFLLM